MSAIGRILCKLGLHAMCRRDDIYDAVDECRRPRCFVFRSVR